MQLTSENNVKIIKQLNKQLSADKEPVSSRLEGLFLPYKAPSANVQITDGYLKIASQITFSMLFNISSLVIERNEFLDYLIPLFSLRENCFLTPNTYKLLSNT